MKKPIRTRSLNRAHLEAVSGGGARTYGTGTGWAQACPSCSAGQNSCSGAYTNGATTCGSCSSFYWCNAFHQVRNAAGTGWINVGHNM